MAFLTDTQITRVEHAIADTAEAQGVLNSMYIKCKKLEIGATPTGSEQDTLFDLPALGLVLDVFLHCKTAEATGGTTTMDIGLLSSESSGDADGFIDGIDCSATGVLRPSLDNALEVGALMREASGSHTWSHHIKLADLADGDIVTTITPGYAGTIDKVFCVTGDPATTAAKLSSLNLEIGTTNTTGGVVALTSANCTPIGAVVAGSAITAANAFGAADTISLEAASTTTFIEGETMFNAVLSTYAKHYHQLNSAAVSVTYTAGSSDWAEFRGDLYVFYLDMD